jgi:uncharacterized protein (TIGR04168 family)
MATPASTTGPPADSPSGSARIGIVGDLHDHWTDHDAEMLNAAGYDLVLFVGDLGRGKTTMRRIVASIARLRVPALVMPGNADAPHAPELAAELSFQRGLDQLLDARPRRPGAPPSSADDLRGVRLCGYSLHRMTLGGMELSIVAGRPYSMGGPDLSFGPALHSSFGVDSMAGSTRRLTDLVDRVETKTLVFVSHNGPRGLGAAPTDPWGCDFKPDGGDWGDPDLEAAIDHARARGRRVQAVVAGHMHLELRDQTEERRWRQTSDDTLYVNPARVPRIVYRDGIAQHHHVALQVNDESASAEEVYVAAGS